MVSNNALCLGQQPRIADTKLGEPLLLVVVHSNALVTSSDALVTLLLVIASR